MSEMKTVLMSLASSNAMSDTVERETEALRAAIPAATITQLPADIEGFGPGALTWVAATYAAPKGDGSDLARDISDRPNAETAWAQWDPEAREFAFATYCEGEETQSDATGWDPSETEDEFRDYCRTFGPEAKVMTGILLG